MSKKSKKAKAATTSAQSEFLLQKQSFQEWLPISDVNNGFIKTKNFLFEEYYPVIQLGDININLMTSQEKYRFAKDLEIALSSMTIDEYEIIILPLPYDLGVWIQSVADRKKAIVEERKLLEKKLAEEQMIDMYSSNVEAIRQDMSALDYYDQHLTNQQKYVTSKLADGSILSKKAFFIPKITGCDNLSEYQEATNTIVSRLSEKIPFTHQCNSQEVRNVLFTILNPLNRQYVKTPARQEIPRMNWNEATKNPNPSQSGSIPFEDDSYVDMDEMDELEQFFNGKGE